MHSARLYVKKRVLYISCIHVRNTTSEKVDGMLKQHVTVVIFNSTVKTECVYLQA